MRTLISILFVLLSVVNFQIVAQIKADAKAPKRSDTVSKQENTPINLEELVKTKNDTYVITAEHTSRTSGIHHMYLRQAINGIEVFGTESSIHRDAHGKIINTHNNFVKDIQSTARINSPNISSSEAINFVAEQMEYTITNLEEIERKQDPSQESLFNGGGISVSNIPVKLMYYYQENMETILVWELSVEERTSSDWWNFFVDATTGVIISRENWTVSCLDNIDHNHSNGDNDCDEESLAENKLDYTVPSNPATIVGSYNVVAMPAESPGHSGRTVVADPHNAIASPFGWHDTDGLAGAESEYTIGNNADAYDDITSTSTGTGSGVDSERAFGGPTLTFSDSFNPVWTAGSDANRSIKAAVTNLFYWSNIVHDLMYLYGFDEASGNFQDNNYGNGGIAGDSVRSEAQDGSGTCNANFSTPTDGSRGRMQMYVCGSRDGDFDNGVVAHEYGHGISTRLTGGAGTSSCLNNTEQMGEGWSDFFGMIMTIEPGDAGTDPRGMGTWLLGQPITGLGIRTQRYDTDDNTYTYNTIKTAAIPHGIGSVWAMMLWEMTWDLIAVHGFDADFYNGSGGNNIALAIVMEGLKLQPCSPGFVDGRDAILAADFALYGGANQCTIWSAFARRGLGYSADQGATTSRTDGTEAYDLPPGAALFTNSFDELCITDGVQVGVSGGLPAGGVYSGSGVTDDGNGATYTFDPSVPGPGITTVTYTVFDGCSGTVANLDETIEIKDGAPQILCQDITLTLDGSGNATLDPFSTQATLVGGNNGSGNPGFSALMVTLTSNATISFDWSYSTLDTPAYDSFGYILGTTYYALSTSSGTIQNGSFSIDLLAGQDFGFCTYTSDNDYGAATGVVTNFSPGFIGQFAQSNFTEMQQNSDGVATIDKVNMISLLDSCSTVSTLLSQTSFTCLDVGVNAITVVTTDDSNGLTDSCTTMVTILPGAAATATFSGGSWIPGAPSASTIAIFDDSYDTGISGNVSACSCTINIGNTLNIRSGDNIDIEGNINVDGSLIVEHQGSVVQSDDTALVTNNGTINVELTTPALDARDFMIMGSPMTEEDDTMNTAYQVLNHTTANFTPYVGSPPVVGVNFHDQEFDDWSNYTGILTPGEGYLVRPSYTSGGTYNYVYDQGTLNNGVITYPAYYGDNKEDSPNVLSNPYASAIDAVSFINANPIVSEVYFWEHLTTPAAGIPGPLGENFSMEDISMYNLSGGTPAANGGGTPNNVISTGQGFGIKANSAGDVTFNNSMRLTSGNTTLRRPIEKNLIWLTVRDSQYHMGSTTLIGFMETATIGYDEGYDSMKLGTVVSLYSHLEDGSEILGIQGRESFDTSKKIPMGFSTMIDPDNAIPYTISISAIEGSNIELATVYLVDHQENTITNLSEGDYTFLSDAATYNNRFTLQFEPEVILGTSENNLEQISIFPNPTQDVLTIVSPQVEVTSVIVYDLRGRVVAEKSFTTQNNYQIDLSKLETAMYFVKIDTKEGTLTKRIVKQ